MARRDRVRRPARRSEPIDVRKRYLVYTEGKRTEVDYLRGLESWARTCKLEIQPEHGDPTHLVKLAKAKKKKAEKLAAAEGDENANYDGVWCVFDRDEWPNLNDAWQSARDCGIEIFLSNPCFDLWLALHFIASPGPMNSKAMEKLRQKHDGAKGKEVNFEKYKPGYADAVRRAARLDVADDNVSKFERNPSTDMYKLVQKIKVP